MIYLYFIDLFILFFTDLLIIILTKIKMNIIKSPKKIGFKNTENPPKAEVKTFHNISLVSGESNMIIEAKRRKLIGSFNITFNQKY